MVMDSYGSLGTFTCSSWGGHYAVVALIPQFGMQQKRAFPICALKTNRAAINMAISIRFSRLSPGTA
jgi:hypothetical protein